MRASVSGVTAIAIAVCAALTIASPGRAEDPAAQSSTTAPALQGGVVKIDVTLNELRDARLSISRARKAAANLYDEVTRQQVTMTYNPNLVGTTVIMTPTPTFSGGYLPARPKWVKASMAEIGPIVNLLKEDVDQAVESNRRTDVSESAKRSLEPLRTEAFDSVNKSFEIYKHLEQLTAVPSYDNDAISVTVKSLDAKLKELDRELKKGISILQKDAKSAKKNKTTAVLDGGLPH